MAAGLSSPRARRASIARSAFLHDACCVRTAPTMVSNGPSEGHQAWGP
jgi:hypothetical protein